MPPVRFEPTISAVELAKTVHASHHAATVIGNCVKLLAVIAPRRNDIFFCPVEVYRRFRGTNQYTRNKRYVSPKRQLPSQYRLFNSLIFRRQKLLRGVSSIFRKILCLTACFLLAP
jgi:hypothetical protein